jgi:hypothetical protein
MAGIDFSYAPGSANSLAASYNASQQNRIATEGAQLANQTAQTKLDQLRSDRQMMLQLQDQLREAGKDPDLNKVFDALIQSGRPDYVQHGVEGKQRLKAQNDYAHLFDPIAAPAAAPVDTTPAAPTNALTPSAPTNALAAPRNVLPAVHAPMTGLGDNTAIARQTRDRIDALMRFAGTHAGTPQATQAETQATTLNAQLKNYVREPNVQQQNYEYAVGQGYKGSLNDFLHQHEPKAASTTIHNPSPPVPVQDPNDPTKTILVDRREAIDKRMTPASAQTEGLAPKELLKRNATYPHQTLAIKSVNANVDSFIKDLQKLADHPGLSSITGLIAGNTPNLTGDARAAQALYDKIVSKGGFSVLQAMRDASKTGGALGNLSDKEGAQLKSAFAAINKNQDTADVKRSLEEAVSTMEASKARLQDAYDSTYEYKSKDAAAPVANKGGATESFDAGAGKGPTVSGW